MPFKSRKAIGDIAIDVVNTYENRLNTDADYTNIVNLFHQSSPLIECERQLFSRIAISYNGCADAGVFHVPIVLPVNCICVFRNRHIITTLLFKKHESL